VADPKPPVNLTVDGQTVSVPAGTNVLEAAKLVGIRVPNFCYHQDLTWEGSCRMCLVAIDGRPKLVPSCCEEAREGMVVHVGRPDAEEARRRQLEFLLINHPLDCPICDQAGECKLQDYYMEHGQYDSKMPRDLKVHKRKVVDLGERIMLDKERCVLCSRCVRFCREVSGSHALQFFTRGVTTEIGSKNNEPIVGDDYIGNVVDICPVGALTSKDFRFKQRVWFLKSAESVCNRCSTGCNVRVDHKDGVVYRYVPRRNAEVNKSWMCDYGRDSYRMEQEDRILTPLLREGVELRDADWSEALELVARRMRDARAADPASVAFVASPRQPTETLWLTRRWAREVVKTPHLGGNVDGSNAKTGAMQDDILRRQDPHPNNRGIAALGIGPAAGGADVEGILDACQAGKIKVLHLLAPDVLTARHDRARVLDALAKVPCVVVHAYRNAPALTDVAHVVLPDASHLEQEGTFVNAQGRVQRFAMVFPPPGQARPATAVLAQLAERLDASLPTGEGHVLFDVMAKAEPAFAGLTWAGLGRTGLPLATAEAVATGS